MIFLVLQLTSAVILIYTGLLFLNISTRQGNINEIQITSRTTYLLFALSSLNYGISLTLEIIRRQQQDMSIMLNIFKPEMFTAFIAGAFWVLTIAYYTQVKPRKLLWFICSIFFMLAILNLFLPYGTIFLEITGLGKQNLPWGETILYFEGKTNPLVIVGALNNIITYGYFIYAVLLQYKQRKLYKAIVLSFGISIIIISAIHIYLVDLQILRGFDTLPFAFLITIIIMAFQFSNDIVKTQLQLEYYNNHLEDEINIRTKNLQEAIKKSILLEERNRIAQQIHDSVNQTLHSLVIIANTLPKIWQTHPEEILSGLNAIKRMSNTSLREMRTVILNLYPHHLTKKPLCHLIRELSQKINDDNALKIDICIDEQHSKLAAKMQIVAYRVIEESVYNIIRHSQASHAKIHLDCAHLNSSQDKLQILVEDNGIGFNPDKILPDHLGINFMKESCEKIGAKLTIISKPNQGTKVLLECPIVNQEEY